MNKGNFGKIKVVVFCGGSGARNLIEALIKNPLFDVCVIVNAYDDGKSTGYLRKIIPGFLGPSDVRKNISCLINAKDPEKRILKDILEYRYPVDTNQSKALQDLYNIIQQKTLSNPDLDIFFKKLTNDNAMKIRIYLKAFLEYLKERKINFDFNDCAFGNILLAGAFLRNGKNFNLSIGEMASFLETRGEIINATNGENLILAALLKNGEYLPTEASIVEKRANDEIEEIFLFKDYLSGKIAKKLEKLSVREKLKYLRSLQITPKFNEKAEKSIKEAEIIIFGAGTQNSSLYPTYLTEGFVEAIVSNKEAKKVFIANIGEDNEIPDATVEDIIDKALYYLNRKNVLKNRKNDVFDYYFVHAGNPEDPKYVKFSNKYHLQNVIHDDFEKEFSGKHDGNKILSKLLDIYSNIASNDGKIKKLSIIIPAYNEARFILPLLRKIRNVDLLSLGVVREIIFVDNGSTDNTYKLLKEVKDIKLLKIKKNIGKGDAVLKGIKAATGDIVVIQDADLEYNPEDIKEMLRMMLKYNFKAVYGSRTLRKGMRAKALSILYPRRSSAYLSYYIGGQLLSLMTLVLYGKYITDTVTGYKMIDAKLLKTFQLKSRGFELDHEITAKLLKGSFEIFEIPISYNPRTIAEGKKIKWWDGVIALWTLFNYRFVN